MEDFIEVKELRSSDYGDGYGYVDHPKLTKDVNQLLANGWQLIDAKVTQFRSGDSQEPNTIYIVGRSRPRTNP